MFITSRIASIFVSSNLSYILFFHNDTCQSYSFNRKIQNLCYGLMLLKKLLQTKIFISQNNMTMLLKKEGLGVHGIDKYFEVLLINQMIIKHSVLDTDLYIKCQGVRVHEYCCCLIFLQVLYTVNHNMNYSLLINTDLKFIQLCSWLNLNRTLLKPSE